MSLHYSHGKLLLKNTSDGEWYFLDARIGGDLLPHLHPEQEVAGDYSLSEFDEYAIIRAVDNSLYKLSLYTNEEGVVTYRLSAYSDITQLPVRVFIKDTTTGLLYALTLTENGDSVYPELNLAGGIATTTQARRCFCPVITTVETSRTITAATVLEECSIVLPVPIEPPTPPIGSEGILGEGGEEILGEGGEAILPE